MPISQFVSATGRGIYHLTAPVPGTKTRPGGDLHRIRLLYSCCVASYAGIAAQHINRHGMQAKMTYEYPSMFLSLSMFVEQTDRDEDGRSAWETAGSCKESISKTVSSLVAVAPSLPLPEAIIIPREWSIQGLHNLVSRR